MKSHFNNCCDYCQNPPYAEGLCLHHWREEQQFREAEADASFDKAMNAPGLSWAMRHGTETDILQAFGDPGDGDLAEYL